MSRHGYTAGPMHPLLRRARSLLRGTTFDVARFTAATYTPLAIAWDRWIVSQALAWAGPNSVFSDGCQPIAVG